MRYIVIHAAPNCDTRMSENLPATKFVFNRRKKATESVEAAVELEIYFDRLHRRWLNTGVRVCLGQWDDRLHVVNRPDGRKLNADLIAFQRKQEDIFASLYAVGLEPSLENYDNYLNGGEQPGMPDSFIDFMRQRIAERDIRPGTKRTQLVALDALLRFGQMKAFSTLTSANLYAFDMWLRKENPKRDQTTIHNYHKRIKVYVNEAYRLGYIKDNPYDHFQDKRGTYKARRPLTPEELRALRFMELPDKLDRVRDMFVFCCYTGLAYADLNAFDYGKHVIVRDGLEYIDGNRIKTGTEFFTPLLKPAREILSKYGNKLPSMSDQKYNDYLHVIEARMDLKKPLTSHVARHTFATTVCLANDIPIETVSKMLGHRHVATTEIYAKIMRENVERHARTLEGLV